MARRIPILHFIFAGWLSASSPAVRGNAPRRRIRIGAILAGAAALATVVSTIVSIWPDKNGPGEAVLELVDLIAIRTGERPLVEVKVRNRGKEVAFIKRAKFTILDHHFAMLSGRVPSSATYDVEFPIRVRGSPTTIEIPLSQSVDPNSPTAVDVFSVVIGVPQGGPSGIHSYRITVELLYNATGQRTNASAPVLISVNSR